MLLYIYAFNFEIADTPKSVVKYQGTQITQKASKNISKGNEKLIMNQELRIKLFSYDHELLDKSVKKIIEIAVNTNCEIKGPIPLPTKKEVFTVCRSPHVYKPAMEQFERRTHKRLIVLKKASIQTIDALKRLIIPSGVEIQITL